MTTYDASKLEQIHAKLRLGAGAVTDTTLLAATKNYKKYVASRYRLLTESDLSYVGSDNLHVSMKLDGQLHFLYKKGDECYLLNYRGRVLQDLPVLAEAKAALKAVDQIILAGELYYQGSDRGRVYDVASALGTNGEPMADALAFGVFDVLEIDSVKRYQDTFSDKQELIQSHIPEQGLFHRIEQLTATRDTLSERYTDWVVNGGQEGVICVDADNHSIFKIKPRHSIDAVVLGFTEKPKEPEKIRVLLVGLMRTDGSIQVLGNVGTGFDEDQRRDLYHRLSPTETASSFKATDRNHTLFTMVAPELVIEISFHDLIAENGQGRPEMKAVLTFDAESGYHAQLAEPFVSMIHPVYKRIREDKVVNADDLRLTQLADFVDLDNLETAAKPLSLARSEIRQREVYTKAAKGLTNIRKFLSWQSNKHELDAAYPQFVFCYVDYSPGRKAPLKRVVRIAQSAEAIDAIFEEFKAAEIKKGWALAE